MQCIVRGDGHLRLTVAQRALRRSDVGGDQRVADVVRSQPLGGERIAVQFDPHRMRRAAEHLHLSHPGNSCHRGLQQRVGDVVQPVRRQTGRGQRHQQYGNLRSVKLEVLRRRRQRREVRRSVVDRRLHLARRRVGVDAEIEQHLDLHATFAGIAHHLFHAGDAAEVTLQRCHHRAGHGLRICARQLCKHHHAGKLQRRQCGNAQQQVRPYPGQHQANGKQRSTGWTANQGSKDIHGTSVAPRCMACKHTDE